MSYNECNVVMIQGSQMMMSGFTGDCAPRAVFPNVTGEPLVKTIQVGMSNTTDFYVGDEAISRRKNLKLQYPIKNGVIVNYDDMEQVWNHTFYNELRTVPEECNVIMGEGVGSTLKAREKIAEIMFETFSVNGFILEQNSVLALICSGRTTGTVVSLGGDVNSVTSIFEASTLSNSEVSEVAGSKISDYLSDLLYKKSVIENTSFLEKEHLTDIKHCVCYVALDAKIEEKKQIMKQYDMDSITLKLGNEVFQCTEPLFNPKLIGSNSTPIQQMIWDCITTKPSDIQSELFNNIILEGGGSMFQGIGERILFELEKFDYKSKIKVMAPPERKYSNWIGGSILSSLDSFRQKWITNQEYQENDASVVNSKCKNHPEFVFSTVKVLNLMNEIVKFVNSKKVMDLNFDFL